MSMKKQFNFVNIAGNTFNTITDELMDLEYIINVSSTAAAYKTAPLPYTNICYWEAMTQHQVCRRSHIAPQHLFRQAY